MKCDTSGCTQEGHIMDKFGVFCHECNDKNIEVMESKSYKLPSINQMNKEGSDRPLISKEQIQQASNNFNTFKQVLEKHKHTFEKLAPNDVHKVMTLPIDSAERKTYPLFAGVLRYFPAALAGVARTSKLGNDKHNPGQELHHARGKSTDHGDCILRHLMDTQDLLAARSRGDLITDQQILDEINCACWRLLALSQEIHESFGYPLAPGAKK